MKILLVKASNAKDVRLQKYIDVLFRHGHELDFIGWNLVGENECFTSKIQNTKYIVKGWNSGKTIRLFGLILWFVKCFFCLVLNKKRYDLIYSADFEAGFPVSLFSKISKTKFIYDIYDDISIRYNMALFLKITLECFDNFIKRNSSAIVHVDHYRIRKNDLTDRVHIVKNAPLDYYSGKFTSSKMSFNYAVVGYLAPTRGLHSIFCFARENPDIGIILAGRFTDSSLERKFCNLPNCTFLGLLPQRDLFYRIKDCCGIFSLYDPNFEINRLAASNKLYDAMMLGIPVITNEGILASEYVQKHKIGFVVQYDYNLTWNILKNPNVPKFAEAGQRGRVIFESDCNFETSAINLIRGVLAR